MLLKFANNPAKFAIKFCRLEMRMSSLVTRPLLTLPYSLGSFAPVPRPLSYSLRPLNCRQSDA